MKLIYSILCSDIITSRETGSTTYVNTIDQITTNGLPVLIPSFSIGTYWSLDEDPTKEYKVKINIITPSDKKPNIPIFDIKEKSQSHRINIKISPFTIEQEGDYIFQIQWKYQNEG